MIKYFQKLKAKKGFTLVELIVVIAIIGVLAAILIPTMLGYVTSSRVASADSTAGTMKDTLNAFITERDGANKGIARSNGSITATNGTPGTAGSGSGSGSAGGWTVSVDANLKPDGSFATKFCEKLAADYPNVTNAQAWFYVYQGTCIFCAFSTQANIPTALTSNFTGDSATPLDFTKNATFLWPTTDGGTTKGTEGLYAGSIIGTSPKLYQS